LLSTQFSKPAAHTVAHDRATHLTTDRKTQTRNIDLVIDGGEQSDLLTPESFSLRLRAQKIRTVEQVLGSRQKSSDLFAGRRYGQLLATLDAPALQDATATGCAHARAKSVRALAPTIVRLVCALHFPPRVAFLTKTQERRILQSATFLSTADTEKILSQLLENRHLIAALSLPARFAS